MFCRRLLVLLALVAALLTATADAQPSRRNVSRRVSDCSNKLNRFGSRPARLFCVAYLKGRQPATPSATLTTTQTATLAAVTTTVPVTVASSVSTTVSETTTTTLTTTTITRTTTTATPTTTVRATATETITVTVTERGAQARLRSDPVPLYDDEPALQKRSALTSSQAASIFGSYIASEITEACLLIVYGRTSNPTKTLTATVTATSTPAPLTATSTTTDTVTATKTDTLTETVTTTTTRTGTVIVLDASVPTQTVTSTVATITVTSTSTVAPAPTVTSYVLKAVQADGVRYASTTDDSPGVKKLSLGGSSAASASRVTYDPTTRLLHLATDPTFESSTFYGSNINAFLLSQDGASSLRRTMTCSLASDTNRLSCTSDQGHTALQNCGNELVIGAALYCIPLSLYLEPVP